MTDDFLDPRNWEAEPECARLLVCWRRELYALLDWADYTWAKDNRWHTKRSSTPGKFYAARSSTVAGRKYTIFLHKDVLLRACGLPPSPEHKIGDHLNGNSLDCRRINLRWATPSQNARNRYGAEYYQRSLGL